MEYQEWLKKRKAGIGGSDASAILGMNPYKTNVELWEEKTGRREPEDISGKPYVQYGKEAEEPLRKLFALDHPQYEVIRNGDYEMHISEKQPFIFGTFDGTLVEKETGAVGVLEIKTTNILQSMQREKWSDKIPDNYYIQILHYMLVKDFQFAKLKAHLISQWNNEVRITQRHYHIERDEVAEDLKYLEAEEIKFWEYVKKDKRPPLRLPTI